MNTTHVPVGNLLVLGKVRFSCLLVAVCLFAGHAGTIRAAHDSAPALSAAERQTLEDTWGIEIVGLRLSAGGNMVDFRYRVLDPEKAAKLCKPEAKPHLLDQASGTKLLVPKTPKIGALRQTAQKPEAGRVYFVLFSNQAKFIKAGSKVTVVIDEFKAENLVVN